MKVYVVVVEYEDNSMFGLEVFKTRIDAEFALNKIANKLITKDGGLFELYRDDRFVSIGYKDLDGNNECVWYIRILERMVKYYSEGDLKETGS